MDDEEKKRRRLESTQKYRQYVIERSRQMGFCARCFSRKAEPGRKYCSECSEKNRIYSARRRAQPENRAKLNTAQKKIRDTRKEQGLCICCGKPAYENHIHCLEHYRQAHRLNKEHYERNPRNHHYDLQGGCPWCGAKSAEGYKLCPACLEKTRAATKNRRTADTSKCKWRTEEKVRVQEIRYNKAEQRKNAESYIKITRRGKKEMMP